MSNTRLIRRRPGEPPLLIGMVHLDPLPGSPRWDGDPDGPREAMLRDGAALTSGGVDALLIENFGDAPFYPARVPELTVAQISALALLLRQETGLPIGVNVLRNDGLAALAVAHAAGGRFIRVNVLSGARNTDQGLVQGEAHLILRRRRQLGAEQIGILADVAVKHSTPLAARPLEEEALDLARRGGADGLIVSGSRTGAAADAGELGLLRAVLPEMPLLVGSGVTAANVDRFLPDADGLIVGSSLKGGDVPARIDAGRVRELRARITSA